MTKILMFCIALVCLVLPDVSTAGIITDNGDGTVTDSGTHLMWQQGESSAMTWEAALSYCEGLVLPAGTGPTDWRLPNQKELLSLVDDTRYSPKINTALFPGPISEHYWSSTTQASYTTYAWYVNFNVGNTNSDLKTDINYARCVRGGQ